MTPTQRTLKVLRNDGYTPQIVERWLPGANIRKDLFDIGDILAIKEGHRPLLIQVTSAGVSSRVKKIREHRQLDLLMSIFDIEVHGWTKRANGRYKQRIVTITGDRDD